MSPSLTLVSEHGGSSLSLSFPGGGGRGRAWRKLSLSPSMEEEEGEEHGEEEGGINFFFSPGEVLKEEAHAGTKAS